MADKKVDINLRYDDGRNEYVITLDINIPGFGTFEASSSVLSDAVLTLGQYLEDAGV